MAQEKAREKKRDLRMELADELIRRIEEGTAPWQKPWEAGKAMAPVNAVTGVPYRGVNYQNLMMFTPDPTDNRWCTYDAAKKQGWQVREGSVGIPIEVWKEYDRKRTKKEIEKIRAERAAAGEDPNKPIEEKEKAVMVKYYPLFHASQIDGIPPLERDAPAHQIDGKPDPRIDILAEAVGVTVGRGGGRAFYRASEDHVQMPLVDAFHHAAGHDTTFLHELAHATGHESRMNREFGVSFGDQKYAIEELRAEMSAAMTAAAMGIGFDPEAQNVEEGREVGNSAAYLASWLGALPEKERKQIVVQTIKDAQKISDYLLERVPELQVEAPEKSAAKEVVQPSTAVSAEPVLQPQEQQDLGGTLKTLEGKTINLPNGKEIDAYQYLEQGLKRGYEIQVSPGKDGEVRWVNNGKPGGLIQDESLASVLRAAQKEPGQSLGDTLRGAMAKTQERDLQRKAPQKTSAALELA